MEANVMGKKISDEKLDKLFEGMSRETARKVNNQGSPANKSTKKKAVSKKKVK